MKIRPATVEDAPAIGRVHVASWRSAYQGIVPAEHLARLTEAGRTAVWQGILARPGSQEHVFVAEDDSGQVVAFASGGPEREGDEVYTGELYAIYALADQQGKGLGRALTHAVADALAQDGFKSMLVWVLAANRARGFYEHLGGQPVREKPVQIGGAELEEVAYGWTDTAPLRTESA